jgi:hypothetical protein
MEKSLDATNLTLAHDQKWSKSKMPGYGDEEEATDLEYFISESPSPRAARNLVL